MQTLCLPDNLFAGWMIIPATLNGGLINLYTFDFSFDIDKKLVKIKK
jgi:hypothetical protein